MAWILDKCDSHEGEKPGYESIIGFRGTRYSVNSVGKLYITDYNGELTQHTESDKYVLQLRNILKFLTNNWSGRLRIRGNGDTYCKYEKKTYYVGRTIMDGEEYFPGYTLNIYPENKTANVTSIFPQNQHYLYSGSHNSGQIGERWTIPAKSFASKNNKIGNVGIKIRKGEWAWSSSSHSNFIKIMRQKFYLESFIRFYITSNGFLVRPIDGKYWSSYGIDITEQIKNLSTIAPKSEISANIRINISRAKEDNPTLYFCFGHIDDILEGELPSASNIDDDRAKDIDQDSKKWG